MTNHVPSSWAVVPLGQIADVQLGKMLSARARAGRGARPYLRNINVRWHHIDTSDVLEMDFDAREVEKYHLRTGDVLVCEGGEPGRAAVWEEQMPNALYQKALHRVRFREGALDPKLLTYQLELAAWNGSLARSFTGSTIKHLPREAFIEWRTVIPPLAEQPRIVAALEEHLSDLDAAVAALERVQANQRRYLNAVAGAAVDGSLLGHAVQLQRGPQPWSPAVPSHWQFATVGQLADLVEYGTSAKTQQSNDGVPVLRMGNIVDGELSWTGLKHLPASHSEFPRLFLRSGDVLFNRTNSPELVGKTAVYEAEHPAASFASYLLRVRLKPGLEPRYFSAFLNSHYGRAWVASVVTQQVGQANVNSTKLRSLSVPVPPADEQKRLVSDMQARFDAARRMILDVNVQQARAARLRQSILKRAFEGKLVSQDPNDEPASALLERIRSTTSLTPAAPRSRTASLRPTMRRRRA